jgi:hypothetical protein
MEGMYSTSLPNPRWWVERVEIYLLAWAQERTRRDLNSSNAFFVPLALFEILFLYLSLNSLKISMMTIRMKTTTASCTWNLSWLTWIQPHFYFLVDLSVVGAGAGARNRDVVGAGAGAPNKDVVGAGAGAPNKGVVAAGEEMGFSRFAHAETSSFSLHHLLHYFPFSPARLPLIRTLVLQLSIYPWLHGYCSIFLEERFA